MIDASHSNSHKICRNQINVVSDIAEQISEGSPNIMGVMIESNLSKDVRISCRGSRSPTVSQ